MIFKKFRTVFLALAAVLVGLGTVIPFSVSAQPASGPPPLIDRDLFFGDPEISGAQISPDGKFIELTSRACARKSLACRGPIRTRFTLD